MLPSPYPPLINFQIFRKFSSQDIIILHPRLLNLGKCSIQDKISTVTKNHFNISPKIFRHRLFFVRISEVIAL